MSRLPKLLFLRLARKSFFSKRELCRGELSAFCWISFLNFLFFIFFRVRLQELKRKGEKKEELRLLTTSKVIHLKTPFSSERRLIAS